MLLRGRLLKMLVPGVDPSWLGLLCPDIIRPDECLLVAAALLASSSWKVLVNRGPEDCTGILQVLQAPTQLWQKQAVLIFAHRWVGGQKKNHTNKKKHNFLSDQSKFSFKDEAPLPEHIKQNTTEKCRVQAVLALEIKPIVKTYGWDIASNIWTKDYNKMLFISITIMSLKWLICKVSTSVQEGNAGNEPELPSKE